MPGGKVNPYPVGSPEWKDWIRNNIDQPVIDTGDMYDFGDDPWSPDPNVDPNDPGTFNPDPFDPDPFNPNDDYSQNNPLPNKGRNRVQRNLDEVDTRTFKGLSDPNLLPGANGDSGGDNIEDDFWDIGGYDFGDIFGEGLGGIDEQRERIDERYGSLNDFIMGLFGQGAPQGLTDLSSQLQGFLSEGLSPTLRQAATGNITNQFDRQQRGLTEQFAGQRGGALSAATAQLGGQEGLALGQLESELATLESQRELTLLDQLGGVEGQIADVGLAKELGLTGELGDLATEQTDAEGRLIGQELDFTEAFAQLGIQIEELDAQASQFAQGLELEWSKLNQEQRQFASVMLLDEAKFEETIRQFDVSEQNKLKALRMQIQAGEMTWEDFAGSVLGFGAAVIASDFRVKENIKEVGISEEGIPIVEFNYIGQPKRWQGVIAQDVEKIMPNAVTTHHGVKHVDYSQLTVKMVECYG